MNANLIEAAEALASYLNNPLNGTTGWYERALIETGANKFFCELSSNQLCRHWQSAYVLTDESYFVIVEFHSMGKGFMVYPVENR